MDRLNKKREASEEGKTLNLIFQIKLRKGERV